MPGIVERMIFHSQQPSALDELAWLLPSLPAPRQIEVRCEADYYGAGTEIAAAIGLGAVPPSYGTWKHGWNCVPTLNAEAIAGYKPGPRPHLMGDKDQEALLRGAGYPNAVAVGYPILYAGHNEIQRRPKSLLVAPYHSLPEITPHSEQKQNEEAYVDYLKSLRARFDVICVSIHSSCLESRLWVDTLERHGIAWVLGAMTSDAMALRRVKTLFHAFDVVLTNSLTSVVPYAATFGARVSIAGPSALLPPVENYAKHPYYQKHPELLNNLKLRHPDRLRELHPGLFCPPEEAGCPAEWADGILGRANMVRHEDVARLLGWRHVEGDPFWQQMDAQAARMRLGWVPACLGSQEAVDKMGDVMQRSGVAFGAGLEHFQSLNLAAKEQAKQLKSLAKDRDELAAIRETWTWRLVFRHLVKLERSIRRRLGRPLAQDTPGREKPQPDNRSRPDTTS